ncbi:MAG: hypothetical protein SGI73_21195 [Chloroflexota bacterium]|nr:hypothetical protein [Chloroflexota bacterium]
MGFAAWDIDRILTFGALPADASLLQGAFDVEAIRIALGGREYIEAEIAGVKAQCWVGGCDEGFRQDMTNLYPMLPFGGNLGVRPPFAFPTDDVIAVSRDLTRLTAMVEAGAGSGRSLRDDNQWMALARALTDARWGALAQVMFVTPLDLQVPINRMPARMADQVSALGDLPTYEAAALADYDAGAEQVHLIAAVYADADLATAAADELAARLAAFNPSALYEEIGVTLDQPLVIPFDGGAVAIAALRYPYAAVEGADFELAAQPGAFYRRWIQSIYQRRFLPLLLSFE